MNAAAPKLQKTHPFSLLTGVLRLMTAIFISVLSIITLVSSIATLSIGHIIASVHLLPASLVLLALELEFFHVYLADRFQLTMDEMYPARMIALQFLAAVLCGINDEYTGTALFIMGCIAFGTTVGLVHLNGIHGLFWEGKGGFYNHSRKDAKKDKASPSGDHALKDDKAVEEQQTESEAAARAE
jgi:hypothetical protein